MFRSTQAKLALEDGTVFTGSACGASGTAEGEVVFNTSMTGYQEILTDPSYKGQIVNMTYPLIGNYGVNRDDAESRQPHVAALVVREMSRRYSNWRASLSLPDYLRQHHIVAIEGIDTRALTRRLRTSGAMRGIVSTELLDDHELVRRARNASSMTGADWVQAVRPETACQWTQGFVGSMGSDGSRDSAGSSSSVGSSSSPSARDDEPGKQLHVVAIDCGAKHNILRHLIHRGLRVTVVPPDTSADDLLALKPDGIFVSNGPGDPAALDYAVEPIRQIIQRLRTPRPERDAPPLFGICLGLQLLGRALGADTYKLKFGHRGGNHPVKNLDTGRVEITSQNHGFAVDRASLEAAGGVVTHVNLNDGTVEGFRHRDLPIFSVQYHPEASPGPHDADYLFDSFVDLMKQQNRAG